jgi:hypothetical protein
MSGTMPSKSFFTATTAKKVLVAGGTTLLVVYVGKNVIGMQPLPPESMGMVAVNLAIVSGLGCVLGDMFVSPALAGYF